MNFEHQQSKAYNNLFIMILMSYKGYDCCECHSKNVFFDQNAIRDVQQLGNLISLEIATLTILELKSTPAL